MLPAYRHKRGLCACATLRRRLPYEFEVVGCSRCTPLLATHDGILIRSRPTDGRCRLSPVLAIFTTASLLLILLLPFASTGAPVLLHRRMSICAPSTAQLPPSTDSLGSLQPDTLLAIVALSSALATAVCYCLCGRRSSAAVPFEDETESEAEDRLVCCSSHPAAIATARVAAAPEPAARGDKLVYERARAVQQHLLAEKPPGMRLVSTAAVRERREPAGAWAESGGGAEPCAEGHGHASVTCA